MKVGNKVGQNVAAPETAKTNKAGGDKRADGKSSVAQTKMGDMAKVNVSDRAQAMQKAKDIASQDTVDEAKVARLQKLIDEGKYKVDSKAVADRLVDEHLNMGE